MAVALKGKQSSRYDEVRQSPFYSIKSRNIYGVCRLHNAGLIVVLPSTDAVSEMDVRTESS